MKNLLRKNIYRKKTIKKIEKKCKLLGVNNTIEPVIFMNIRLLITILLFLGFLFTNNGFIYAPIISLVFYIGSEYYLDLKIKKRSNKLNNESIFFFQIFILSLESGKNLKGALELTCENLNNEISAEFKQALLEVELGKSLTEALNSIKERIPSKEINNIILNIKQSSIFGNNIIDSLNNQIDYLRENRLLSIKAIINKMPMKISVISVIFIIPIVLLLVLGPVVINFILNS
ncbi:MAG: type II secretion system F family protein [Bacilli bacterium]|nr:type II secretion system F family protein [Bacilli bacterium]